MGKEKGEKEKKENGKILTEALGLKIERVWMLAVGHIPSYYDKR